MLPNWKFVCQKGILQKTDLRCTLGRVPYGTRFDADVEFYTKSVGGKGSFIFISSSYLFKEEEFLLVVLLPFYQSLTDPVI
jgi:hypothetical protein